VLNLEDYVVLAIRGDHFDAPLLEPLPQGIGIVSGIGNR